MKAQESIPPSAAGSGLADHRVPVIEKFAFGMRAFAQQVGSNGITLFAFPAYGMILGLSPATIGLVFALMRIYDGIIDQFMGWISDNTRTRWGRRRPYIFAGSILGGIVFAILWLPSPEWSETAKTGYFIVFSLLFYTFYTVMTIPGDALGLELTPDYTERTRVMTWFSMTIKITSLILPWMFALTQLALWTSEAQGLRVVGIFFGVLFAITGIIPAIFCKERNFHLASQEGKQPLIPSLKLCLANRTYLLVCAIVLFTIFGGTVYLLLGTHLAVYYLFAGNKVEGGQFFGVFGTVAALVGIASIVVINRFFIHADKRTIILTGMATAVCGWLAGIFMITPANPWLTLVPVCLNAIGVSSFWLVIGSLMADVADEDELKNGHRREGTLSAFISFLCKVAGTLAAVFGGFVLSGTGFDAGLAQQSPQTLLGLKAVYVGFPIVGYGIAFSFAWHYPLHKARMLEIRAALEQRRGSVLDNPNP